MHRPHAHVADEQEREPVDRAELLPDRVEVGEDLRRVLAPAVAAVDHRHRGPVRRLRRRALLEVPHRDHVGVELEHVDRVLHRLLVEVAGPGHLRVGEAEHVAAEPVHRGLRRHPRARARLVEGRQQRLVREQIGVAPVLRDRRELVADLEDALELVPLKVLERQDVATEKAPHLCVPLSRLRGTGHAGEQHGDPLVVADERRARAARAGRRGRTSRSGRRRCPSRRGRARSPRRASPRRRRRACRRWRASPSTTASQS